MSKDIDIQQHSVAFKGFLQIDQFKLSHELFAGGMSATIERELFQRGAAVAVLPYDPVADTIVLVEQFRIGAMPHKGGAWLLEPIAGMVEVGEKPGEVAHREAKEEANCDLLALEHVCDYLVSPGVSTELTHVYCAKVDSREMGGIFGLDEEHEDIKVHVIDREKAMSMLTSGYLHCAMTIIGLQWLALNLDRLKEQWLDS